MCVPRPFFVPVCVAAGVVLSCALNNGKAIPPMKQTTTRESVKAELDEVDAIWPVGDAFPPTNALMQIHTAAMILVDIHVDQLELLREIHAALVHPVVTVTGDTRIELPPELDPFPTHMTGCDIRKGGTCNCDEIPF